MSERKRRTTNVERLISKDRCILLYVHYDVFHPHQTEVSPCYLRV